MEWVKGIEPSFVWCMVVGNYNHCVEALPGKIVESPMILHNAFRLSRWKSVFADRLIFGLPGPMFAQERRDASSLSAVLQCCSENLACDNSATSI